MKRPVLFTFMFTLLLFSIYSRIANAAPYSVTIDISSLAGADFEIEIDLFDNNDIIGDSYLLIDNLFISDASGMLTPPGMTDFENGTLQGFDDSLNPDSVNVVSGNVTGEGSYLLQMDEDPLVTPTITFKDYFASNAATLQFDFEYFTTDVSGSFGLDGFIVSILDPITLDPLVPGITGLGDFLEVNNDGISTSQGVTAAEITSVPEPSSLMLLLIGTGIMAYSFKKRITRPKNLR